MIAFLLLKESFIRVSTKNDSLDGLDPTRFAQKQSVSWLYTKPFAKK